MARLMRHVQAASAGVWNGIEEPCWKLQGIFDRKDFWSNLDIRSLTP
jgi:hypothetical protein